MIRNQPMPGNIYLHCSHNWILWEPLLFVFCCIFEVISTTMAVMNFLLDILISSSVSLQTHGGRHGKTKQNAPKDVENRMKIPHMVVCGQGPIFEINYITWLE